MQKINDLLLHDSDIVQTATNLIATTSVNGTDWTAYASTLCKQVTVVNLSGVDIDFRRNTEVNLFTLVDGMFWTFRGLTNANQISMRRTDTGTDQITIVAEAEG